MQHARMFAGLLVLALMACPAAQSAEPGVEGRAPSQAPVVPAAQPRPSIWHRLDLRAAEVRDRLAAVAITSQDVLGKLGDSDVAACVLMPVGVVFYFLAGGSMGGP